jgi:hypothetical protein
VFRHGKRFTHRQRADQVAFQAHHDQLAGPARWVSVFIGGRFPRLEVTMRSRPTYFIVAYPAIATAWASWPLTLPLPRPPHATAHGLLRALYRAST